MRTFTQKEIINDIIDQIKSGQLKPDQRLMTERELMENYNVSRTTIRNVISDLIVQRVVYRIPDVGIFVQKEIIRKTSSVTGFTQMIKNSGRTPKTIIQKFEVIIPDEHILEAMKCDPNSEVYYIERLRYVDDKPFIYEQLYINKDLVNNLEKYNFEEVSLYHILKTDYDLHIHYLQELVSAIMVEGEIAQFLYEQNSGYSLKVEGISISDQDQVIEYGISYFHAEDFSFESVLVNVKR